MGYTTCTYTYILLPTATGSMGQPQLVLAVNAHMHWDPEFGDVKLIQTVMLCYELRNFCDEVARNMRHQPTNQHQGRSSAGLSAEFHKIPIVIAEISTPCRIQVCLIL